MVAAPRTSLQAVGEEESSKRRQILDGARKVFLELGFDGASMGEIARADNPPPPGSERHHLGMWVYSFDDPYPSRLFDEAGELVAECPSFDFRQADTGNTSSYEVEPLTFPALGDRTVAFRLKIQQTLETMTMDFVVVKVGHNTVSVANGAYNGTPDTGVTERAARSVLSGLEE